MRLGTKWNVFCLLLMLFLFTVGANAASNGKMLITMRYSSISALICFSWATCLSQSCKFHYSLHPELCYTVGSTLSPPRDLRWSIEGASVRLSWRHSLIDEPINGYYIAVQVRNSRNKFQAPDFVHVSRGIHATTLQGLWPNSVYKVKVRYSNSANTVQNVLYLEVPLYM